MQKNQLIDTEERLTKEVAKPKITNPLPKKRRFYYILDGQLIFDYQEALETNETNKHNR